MDETLKCARCGSAESVSLCGEKALPLCRSCRELLTAQAMAASAEAAKRRPRINYLKGALGALIGGLLGLILLVLSLIFLSDKVLFFACIFTSALTMYFFRGFGSGLNAGGVAICVVVSTLISILAVHIGLLFVLYDELKDYGFTFSDTLSSFPELMESVIDPDAYEDLFAGMLAFTLMGFMCIGFFALIGRANDSFRSFVEKRRNGGK